MNAPAALVAQPEQLTHPWGDHLTGDHNFFKKFDPQKAKVGKPLWLSYFNPYTPRAIEILVARNLIDRASYARLLFATEYQCPYSKRLFNSFVPLYIQSATDITKYIPPDVWWEDIASDAPWNKRDNIDSDAQALIERSSNPLVVAAMGTGYTSMFMINDGDNSIDAVEIELSNGDAIVGLTYWWHNK